MKKENRNPFISVLLNGFICYVCIHFWAADLCASQLNFSRDQAYWLLTIPLAIITVVRAWKTACGNDELANWVDRNIKKKH